MRVALLPGCAQRVLMPEINEATVRLLTRLGCEVAVAPGSGCCGALLHHLGDEMPALALARANIDAWERAQQNGGLVWAAVAELGDAGGAVIRAAIGGVDGRGTGHATLVKGSPALRRTVPVFEPQPAPLAALSRRVKEAFDPKCILNPGRMVEGG